MKEVFIVNDLTNKKFGKLTPLYIIENHISKNGNKRIVWHCRCDCGNETDVMALNLTRGHTKSCGCARIDGRIKISRNVSGERFGNLVGIKKIENPGGRTKWLFKCDCGKEVICFLSNVTTGKTKTCGKNCGLKSHPIKIKKTKGYRRDLSGKTFGRLKVLEQLNDKNGYTQFRCQCICGNEKIVSGDNLRYGVTKSCGCLHKEIAGKAKYQNLIGERFYKLTVVDVAPTKYDKLHWLCMCDCGNKTIVSTSGLKSGHTKSCGCYQDEVASATHYIDLTGKVFGKLKVIGRAENSKTGMTRFKCLCECGNFTTVMSSHLVKGTIQSCGCWKYSKLEEYVIKYFNEKKYINGVDYECQKKFPDLKEKKLLSYDFIVYKNNEPYYLIECQGLQHYNPVDYFGGEEKFEIQLLHDKLKKEYSNNIGVPLLEIPYTIDTYQKIVCILENLDI